jgi:phosphatidate cytidylyltransferase
MSAGLLASGLFFLFTVRSRERLEQFVRDWGILFLTTGYLYIPLYFLLELKKLGANYLFFLIFVIAVGDSGAYFVGSALGKHKIYPVASPKKSLEGLIAAIVTAALSGWLATLLFPVAVDISTAMLTAAVIGLFSQLSDPVESLFKRAADKKDSGSLLPGHGGILDRMDSYIFCAPLLFYLIRYFWK